MSKIKKITLFLGLFFIGIMITYGAEDCEPTKNNANSDDRVLTCDETKATVTNYEYPKGVGNWAISLDNPYCRIECKEYISLSFEGIQRTYAGMGFSYPLNVSATRSCKSTYKNVENFDKLYRQMVDAYMVLHGNQVNGKPREDVNEDGYMNAGDVTTVNGWANTLLSLDGKRVLAIGNPVDTLRSEIMYMKGLKTTCNEWGVTKDKYELNPTVGLNIATTKGNVTKNYKFVETSPYVNTKSEDESTLLSCSLSEALRDGARELNCRDEKTIIGWTDTSIVQGRYSMPVVNLELYSGKVIENEKGEIKTGQCIAGEKYFTDFEEATRPALNDKNDKGYPLVLKVTGIGNNIDKTVAKGLNLTVNCSYQVLNVSSPQKITTPGTPDSVYWQYKEFITGTQGLNLHEYRVIDVKEPFPGREPLTNWNGLVKVMINGKVREIPLKEYYITEKGTSIRSNTLYTIKLNSSSIKRISNYNNDNPYGIFNLDKNESSVFLKNNISIIEKGR